jgi:hypothetical protein
MSPRPAPRHPADELEMQPLVCHRCGALLTRGDGSFHVVRIEAFADPSPPDLDAMETRPGDIAELIERMKEMSEQELMDQVHRTLVLLLCRSCYTGWIEDPTG